MLLTAKSAAGALRMDLHQVYYLLTMGEIEAVKIGKAWRLAPDSVSEYAKRHPERKNRESSGYFIYPGNGGFLFDCIPDSLSPDPQRKTAGVERRRGQLVHCAKRPYNVLLQKFKSVVQLELFSA